MKRIWFLTSGCPNIMEKVKINIAGVKIINCPDDDDDDDCRGWRVSNITKGSGQERLTRCRWVYIKIKYIIFTAYAGSHMYPVIRGSPLSTHLRYIPKNKSYSS